MLNRRYLRVKVLQSLYAFLMTANDNLAEGEKLLLFNFKKLTELSILQLSLLLEIIDFSEKRIEEAKGKFFPTQEELTPNLRFVENRFLKQLRNNRNFQKQMVEFKINWAEEYELIRKLFVQINESKFFQKYLENPIDSYVEDKEIIVKIIKNIFTESELLEEFYEEKSIYWIDDYDTANVLMIKIINLFEENHDEYHLLPTLFKGKDDDDRLFMIDLFRKTALYSEEFDVMIKKKLTNWDFDRLAYMDILLIKMAICEILHFSSIPVKVTLNEYIEISKFFSTPKSKIFINGILDKLAEDFKKEKLFKKSGRGLM